MGLFVRVCISQTSEAKTVQLHFCVSVNNFMKVHFGVLETNWPETFASAVWKQDAVWFLRCELSAVKHIYSFALMAV